MGIPYVSGEANFMMIKLPISDTLAYRKMMKKGVMIRSMTGFRYPNYIRLTLHPHEAMEAFVEALQEVVT
jgi:histidinol-phosphate aminotransferase